MCELATLAQVRHLSVLSYWLDEPPHLPRGLETLRIGLESPHQDSSTQLSTIGRVHTLRRVELVEASLGCVDIGTAWTALRSLAEVVVEQDDTLSRRFLVELERALPALCSVTLVNCNRVDALPLTSRVCVSLE